MKPASFSATALNVAELCPARYKAEHLDRSRGIGNSYATLGSTVHGALELYVQLVYIDHKEDPSFSLLHDMLKLSYSKEFNTFDYDTEDFVDAYEMLSAWFKRHDLDSIDRVISCEVKSNFKVPTSIGEIPFNYIWDRFDEKRPGVFRVVDYKSNRWNITHEDLRKKIQARAYALAAAIELKSKNIEYDKIWVEFDMLRHSQIGIAFTREDNINTWNYILESAEKIIATDDDKVEERLNGECRFCVRKGGCKALAKNIAVGGIHSIKSVEDAIDLRAALGYQKAGLESLIGELDAKILTEARAEDRHEYESDNTRLSITVGKRRAIDAERVEQVIGPKLYAKYGEQKITLGNVDKLLKGKELDQGQKDLLKSLIYDVTGEPRVKIDSKNSIDPD